MTPGTAFELYASACEDDGELEAGKVDEPEWGADADDLQGLSSEGQPSAQGFPKKHQNTGNAGEGAKSGADYV